MSLILKRLNLVWCTVFVLVLSLSGISQSQQPEKPQQEAPSTFGITQLTFSRDGSRLAAAKGLIYAGKPAVLSRRQRTSSLYFHKGSVDIWDLKRSVLRRTFEDFEGPVLHAKLSPDGKTLITASWEYRNDAHRSRGVPSLPIAVIRAFDVETGSIKWSNSKLDFVASIAFSPDGNTLVIGGTGELAGRLLILEPSSGRPSRELAFRTLVAAVIFSPDGTMMALRKTVYSELRAEVKIFETKTWRELHTLKEANSPYEGLFSPGLLRLEEIKNIAFSPDSKFIAVRTASLQKSVFKNVITLWDVTSGLPQRTIEVNHERLDDLRRKGAGNVSVGRFALSNVDLIVCLGYLWDGNIAVLNRSVAASIFSSSTGEMLKGMIRDKTATAIGLSYDGRRAALSDQAGSISVLDLEKGNPPITLTAPLKDRGLIPTGRFTISVAGVSSVALPVGTNSVMASGGIGLKEWDLESAQKRRNLSGDSSIKALDVSRDGSLFVTLGKDKSPHVWDGRTGSVIREIAGHGSSVVDVAIDPSARFIVTAGTDFSIKTWNVSTGEMVRAFSGHSGPVTCLAVSGDGSIVASGSSDRTIRLWDVESGEPYGSSLMHSAPINSIAMASDGNTLVSGCADGTVRIWSIRDGQLLRQAGKFKSSVNAVAVSSDGKYVAAGGDDGFVRICAVATGQEIRQLKGHEIAVYSLDFSSDGATLAVGTGNGAIVLWNPGTGSRQRTLRETSSIPFRR